MTQGITIKRQFQARQGRSHRDQLRAGAKPNVTVGGVLRISRLMALAIRFDQLISNGAVADQTELARLGHVSRARLTQIMNLLLLAPDIQEALLELSPAQCGSQQFSERALRAISSKFCWNKQRQMWVTKKLGS